MSACDSNLYRISVCWRRHSNEDGKHCENCSKSFTVKKHIVCRMIGLTENTAHCVYYSKENDNDSV